MSAADLFIGLPLMLVLIWLCVEFYWPRVFSMTTILFVWAGGPVFGWVYGLWRVCHRSFLNGECIFSFIGGGVAIGGAGIGWWIVADASIKWLRENPPHGKGLFDRAP